MHIIHWSLYDFGIIMARALFVGLFKIWACGLAKISKSTNRRNIVLRFYFRSTNTLTYVNSPPKTGTYTFWFLMRKRPLTWTDSPCYLPLEYTVLCIKSSTKMEIVYIVLISTFKNSRTVQHWLQFNVTSRRPSRHCLKFLVFVDKHNVFKFRIIREWVFHRFSVDFTWILSSSILIRVTYG